MSLDANYAPAWDALGMRYYYDAAYSNGGDAMFRKAGEAYAKAVALTQISSRRRRSWFATTWRAAI